MVTLIKNDSTNELHFNGLSTDTKPTNTFEGMTITNGSSFFEMDTQLMYFYDGEANDWLDQPEA